MMKHSLGLKKYISLLGAAALVVPAGLNAQDNGVPEGLQPVLSSVSDLTIKGSFGAEFGASAANRNRGNAPADSFSTFNVSHLRLGVEATVYDDFHFDTVLSMLPSSFNPTINDLGGEGAGVNLYHATLTYTGFDVTDLTFGYAFPRFGREAYADDEDLITITRSMLSTTLGPSQHTGLAAHGDWDIFDYHVGIYNSDAGGGENASGVYPVSYLFSLSGGVDLDEYARALHEDLTADLRVDYIYNDEAGGFGPGGGEPYKNAFAVSTEVGFMGVDVLYEYMWARANNTLGLPSRPKVHGYSITPSYFVTDRFQAVVRYERMRNTEAPAIGAGTGGVAGGAFGHNAYAGNIAGIANFANKYQAIYLGGNYYLHGENVKLMAGLELAEARDTVVNNFQSRTHTAMTALRMQF